MQVTTLQEFRKRFPEFNDASDSALADALFEQFYSDMNRSEFNARLGIDMSKPAKPTIGRKGDAVEGSRVRPEASAPLLEGMTLGGSGEVVGGIAAPILSTINTVRGEGPTSLVENFRQAMARQDSTLKAAREASPRAAAGLEFTGSLLTAPLLPEVTLAKGATFGKRLVNAGATGTAIGAGSGLLTQNGTLGERLLAARDAGLFGGVLGPLGTGLLEAGGAALNAGARGIVRGGPGNAARLRSAINDSLAVGDFTPSLGQGTGSPFITAIENGLGLIPGGFGILSRSARRTQTLIGEKVRQAANALAPGPSAARAGTAVNLGIAGKGGFVERFNRTSDRLFSQIGISPRKRIALGNVNAFFADTTRQVRGAKAVSDVLSHPRLKALADAIRNAAGKDGKISYLAAQQIRSIVDRDIAGAGLISDIPGEQLKRFYEALREDIFAAVVQAGPQATRAFRRADRFRNAGQLRIDQMLAGITNKIQPEEAFRLAVQGGNGASRLTAVIRSLRPEQQSVLASAVVNRLGRSRSSGQTGLDNVFSTETFLNNWNALDPAARSALFARRSDIREDLDAVARVADRIRRGARSLHSSNRESGALINSSGIIATTLAAVSGNTLNLAAVLITIGGANVGARFLTNPTAVGWLARSTKIKPSKAAPHLAKLAGIAARHPDLREDVQRILFAFTGGEPEDVTLQPKAQDRLPD